MEWWQILLIIVVVAVLVWYLRQQNAKAAEQRKVDEFRRLQAASDAQNRAAAAAPAASARPTDGAGGLLQEAADTASGREYERATEELEQAAADLAAARRDADRAAARQAERADEALVSVQAAAAAHGGAVPGDGTHDCPPGYPIKGNMPSMLYHETGQPSYNRTIAEVCFQNAAAAEAAGFTAARDVAGFVAGRGGSVPGDGTHECPPGYPIKGNMPSMLYHETGQPSYNRTIPEVCFQSAAAAEAAGFTAARDIAGFAGVAGAVEEILSGEAVVDDEGERGSMGEAVVVEEVIVRDDGERGDVVAEAIAAADAGGVPPGAVRGDGSRDCPPAYPIKGNLESMLYHRPGEPTYAMTMAEFCFSSAEFAEAAGYRPALR